MSRDQFELTQNEDLVRKLGQGGAIFSLSRKPAATAPCRGSEVAVRGFSKEVGQPAEYLRLVRGNPRQLEAENRPPGPAAIGDFLLSSVTRPSLTRCPNRTRMSKRGGPSQPAGLR